MYLTIGNPMWDLRRSNEQGVDQARVNVISLFIRPLQDTSIWNEIQAETTIMKHNNLWEWDGSEKGQDAQQPSNLLGLKFRPFPAPLYMRAEVGHALSPSSNKWPVWGPAPGYNIRYCPTLALVHPSSYFFIGLKGWGWCPPTNLKIRPGSGS